MYACMCTYTYLKHALASTVEPCRISSSVISFGEFRNRIHHSDGNAALNPEDPISLPRVGPGSLLTSSG